MFTQIIIIVYLIKVRIPGKNRRPSGMQRSPGRSSTMAVFSKDYLSIKAATTTHNQIHKSIQSSKVGCALIPPLHVWFDDYNIIDSDNPFNTPQQFDHF